MLPAIAFERASSPARLSLPVAGLLLILILVPLGASPLVAQDPEARDPETVVMEQVEAFNAGDLEAFLDFYDEDATYHHRAPDTSWTESGKATLREAFSFLDDVVEGFGVDVAGRLVAGNFVALRERDRRVPADASGALVIYEVRDGLIRNVWVHYPGPRRQSLSVEAGEWPEVTLSAAERARYAGTYRPSGQEEVVVEEDGRGKLRVVREEEAMHLVPEGDRTFAFGRYEDGRLAEILYPQIRLVFVLKGGEVTGYEIRRAEGGEAVYRARKIP